MKKNGTLIFVFIAIAIAIAAIIYFVVKRNGGGGIKDIINNGGGNGGHGGNGGGNVNPAIGKNAWASSDGVKVFNADLSLYKKAKADEWIGKVYSEKYMHIPGEYDSVTNIYGYGSDGQVYILGADPKYAKFVDKKEVYLN